MDRRIQEVSSPSKYEKTETHYFVTGMEATFWEWISLRMGGIAMPYTSYASRAKRLVFLEEASESVSHCQSFEFLGLWS